MQEPTRPGSWEGRSWWNGTSGQVPSDLPGYWRRHAGKRGPYATREVPAVIAVWINWQLARDRPGRRLHLNHRVTPRLHTTGRIARVKANFFTKRSQAWRNLLQVWFFWSAVPVRNFALVF